MDGDFGNTLRQIFARADIKRTPAQRQLSTKKVAAAKVSVCESG